MIKKLEETFTGIGEVKGFEFKQIKRSEKALLYEVYSDKSKHFEVFMIKHTPICIDFKNRIYSDTDFKEVYPKSNDFGKWAFTTKNILRAIDYFESFSV